MKKTKPARKQSNAKKISKTTAFDASGFIGGKRGVLRSEGKQYTIEVKGPPECTDACPAGVNVKAYVNLIANRKFEEAVDVIREANPFPAVCGRVCTRPCEEFCELSEDGDAISIRALKRYASDYELSRRPLVTQPCTITYDEKIAIIGAGPAGLTTAVDLIRLGYAVTVFEEKKHPGGMLRYGIPPYRLPDRILNREIDWIKGCGIEIKTGQKIKDPSSLLHKGYAAVLIAGGAPKSFSLGIEGENAEGVLDALEFLRAVNSGKKPHITGNVVVIGGGSTAFDAARSSIRLGAKSVTLAYRRGFEEMPAEQEEVNAAQEENITILTLAIPKKILTKQGKVTGIECFKAQLGKSDSSGRKKPIPLPNSEFSIAADYIIPAVGAMPDVQPIKGVKVTTPKGVIDVSENGQTVVKGIFAAGDVEMGPSSVVDAIGRGHQAAHGIHDYLRKIKPAEPEDMVKTLQIYLGSPRCSKRQYTPKKHEMQTSVCSFEEVEESYSDFQAVEEASRCFSCGPCYACPVCLPNCKNKQLVANIEDMTVLVKSPLELSLDISQKGPTCFSLTSDGKTKTIKLFSLTSFVDETLCIGCGRCEEVCSYRAIKNVISKNERPVSQVAHDACASCSACVSECPAGAISQGYMTDEHILHRLETKHTPHDNIKGLISFWSTPSPVFNAYDGFVELMSTRKISPSFLLRALARTARGLLIIKPDQATGSHYLPWEESPEHVIHSTKQLLSLVGISPHRIQYKELAQGEKPTALLDQFAQELDAKNLGPLRLASPAYINSPLGESLAVLRMLSAHPDQKPVDTFVTLPEAQPNQTVLFEGCLPLLQHMGTAHQFFDLLSSRSALYSLINLLDLNAGHLESLSCPSTGLLQSNTPTITDIVHHIQTRNQQILQIDKPKNFIVATPESYESFQSETTLQSLSSLPNHLLKQIKSCSIELKPIPKTIALHHACAMNDDPFYNDVKQLLSLIPEIKMVELESSCGNTKFEQITGESKNAAIDVMKEAAKKNADMILCTSPYCQSHLLLCSRQGSWRSTDIPVSDIYQLLYSSITGES